MQDRKMAIVVGAYVFCLVLASTGATSYVEGFGLALPPIFPGDLFYEYLAALVLLVVYFDLAFSRKRVHAAKRFSAKPVFAVALVLLLPLSIFVAIPPSIAFGYGVVHRVRISADIPAIRAWAARHQMPDSTLRIEPASQPACVRRLDPESVYLQPREIGLVVDMGYGGGFFHYNIVVGPPDMPIPNSNVYEDDFAVGSGCYVWVGR